MDSGPQMLKEQRGELDNDRMGRKEKEVRNKKRSQGGPTVNSWSPWTQIKKQSLQY